MVEQAVGLGLSVHKSFNILVLIPSYLAIMLPKPWKLDTSLMPLKTYLASSAMFGGSNTTPPAAQTAYTFDLEDKQ